MYNYLSKLSKELHSARVQLQRKSLKSQSSAISRNLLKLAHLLQHLRQFRETCSNTRILTNRENFGKHVETRASPSLSATILGKLLKTAHFLQHLRQFRNNVKRRSIIIIFLYFHRNKQSNHLHRRENIANILRTPI